MSPQFNSAGPPGDHSGKGGQNMGAGGGGGGSGGSQPGQSNSPSNTEDTASLFKGSVTADGQRKKLVLKPRTLPKEENTGDKLDTYVKECMKHREEEEKAKDKEPAGQQHPGPQ